MILGTAGHIDHGKTALVHALTGVWTDRLKEERERGISIDLGFAHWDAEPGLRIGVVDVPGHVDFVRNMVAGASGVDAVLFVVSAEEGMMAQSREHLRILAQLGAERGVIAITKRDLVDAEWLDLVSQAVAEETAGTFLEGCPRLPVSVRTGEGLDELRATLSRLARETRRPRLDADFRLPVDRVFTVRGVGTVVTGTGSSGAVALDEVVRVLPGDHRVRVRSIEIHGQPAQRAEAGQRIALALGGAERDRVARGSAVVTGEHWQAGRLWRVRLELSPGAPRPLRQGSRVRVLLGTAEAIGRVALEAGGAPLAPGAATFGQLRLESELVAAPGDRFVLRSYSPVTTIGGGRVLLGSRRKLGPRRLAAAAALHRALVAPSVRERLRAALETRGERGASLEEAAFLAGTGRGESAAAADELGRERALVREAGRLYAATALERARVAVVGALEDFHARDRIRRGMPLSELRERAGGSEPLVERALAELSAEGRLVFERNQARLADRGAELGGREAAWRDGLLARFERAGLEPPAPGEALAEAGAEPRTGRALLERLVEEGRLTKVSAGLYFHAATLRAARESVRGFLSERPLASVGELKDLLGISRKYLIPLLEHFDREGLTRRSAAGRSLARS